MANTTRTTSDLADAPVPEEWRTLSGVLIDGWALHEPISVYIYAEGDEFVATYDDPIPVNAFGATRDDAVAQLRQEIVEHLQWLDDAGDALAPRLIRQRERLRTLVERSGE